MKTFALRCVEDLIHLFIRTACARYTKFGFQSAFPAERGGCAPSCVSTGSFILFFLRALSPFLGHAIAREAPKVQSSCSGGETTQTYLMEWKLTDHHQTQRKRVDTRWMKDTGPLVLDRRTTGTDDQTSYLMQKNEKRRFDLTMIPKKLTEGQNCGLRRTKRDIKTLDLAFFKSLFQERIYP